MEIDVLRISNVDIDKEALHDSAKSLVWVCEFQKTTDLLHDLDILPKLGNCVSSIRWILYSALSEKFILPYSWIGNMPKLMIDNNKANFVRTSTPQAWDLLFLQNKKYENWWRPISHVVLFMWQDEVFHCHRIKQSIIENFDSATSNCNALDAIQQYQAEDDRTL